MCIFPHVVSGSVKETIFGINCSQFVLISLSPNALNKNTGAVTDAVEDVGLEVPQRNGNIC
jgi:hypothetical protein